MLKANLWLGLGSLLGPVLSLFWYMLAIRHVGLAAMGLFTTVIAFLGILMNVGGFGMGLSLVRLVSQNREDLTAVRRPVSVAAFMSLFLGFLLLTSAFLLRSHVLSWLNCPPGDRSYQLFLVLAIGSLSINQLSQLLCSAMQGVMDFSVGVVSEFIYGVIMCVMLGFFMKEGASLDYVGLSMLAASILKFSYSLAKFRARFGYAPVPMFNFSTFKSLLDFGKWVQLGTVFSFFSDVMDKVVMGSLFGNASIPAYALARRVYVQVHGLISNQLYVLFPMLSSKSGGDAWTEGFEQSLFKVVSVLTVCVYSFVILIGTMFLMLFSGFGFESGLVVYVSLFCIIGVIQTTGSLIYFREMAAGRARVIPLVGIFSPVSILLLLVTGKFFGPIWGPLSQLVLSVPYIYLLGVDRGGDFRLSLLGSRLKAVFPSWSLFFALIVSAYFLFMEPLGAVMVGLVIGFTLLFFLFVPKILFLQCDRHVLTRVFDPVLTRIKIARIRAVLIFVLNWYFGKGVA